MYIMCPISVHKAEEFYYDVTKASRKHIESYKFYLENGYDKEFIVTAPDNVHFYPECVLLYPTPRPT